MTVRLWSSSLILSSLIGCVTPSSPQQVLPHAMSIPGQPQAAIWFQGTPEQAFAEARQREQSVFLFWGAVWCPPCNELKANVFVKERFAELMRDFVPVYLDGDTEQAQIWGERLQISGYPTVLILDSEQRELFRMNTSVNMEEFEQLILSLQDSERTKSFAQALERRKSGSMRKADWRILAYSDWTQPTVHGPEIMGRLQDLRELSKHIPAHLQRERVLLSTQWLALAAQAAVDPATQEQVKQLRGEAEEQLARVFADAIARETARSFITGSAGATARWLFGDAQAAGYAAFKQRWLAAATELSSLPRVSLEERLWSLKPELELAKFEQRVVEQDRLLRARVQMAVAQADREAQHAFERHAVISGAAYLLRQVGDYDGAERLLRKELAKTDTPWYYYTSLASLEQARGRSEEARRWAAQARQSARGRATKIQWITNDIVLNAQAGGSEGKAYLLELVREYHGLATQLPDGFVGRNRLRAERVREALAPFRKDTAFVELLQSFQAECANLEGDNRRFCQAHFDTLLATSVAG